MSADKPPEDQLMLLPARTPAEASAWGSAAMEYAAAFQNVHFARDPSRVDWRGYRRVSIVRPSFWPDDLAVIIKQANPEIGIDRIPVDTSDALRVLLNLRVRYGWRYGSQEDFDWAGVWPWGVSLIGLHGRSNGEFEKSDYAIVRTARLEAVKITSHATMATVHQLRAINPNLFILVRPIVSFGDAEASRRVRPQEFVDWTTPDLKRLLDGDASLRYVEIHNEPNLRLEGLGGSWKDGYEFRDWFLEVMRLYRERFPRARLGFPGLSPGPTSASQGRMDAELFLSQAEFAAQQADWVGLHAYWTSEREMGDDSVGRSYERYRERFPEKLLFITEFGNPSQPKAVVAEQYARYYGMLRRFKGLGAAFAYVVSTSDPVESARWAWRDESGKDVGIAAEVGRRVYIP